jgi:hypothetical protein
MAALLLLFGACGTTGVNGTNGAANAAPTVTAIPTSVPPTATPNPAVGIEQTLTAFCQAVHDSNYAKAFGYLSPHYHQLITTPSQVPNVAYQWGKLTNCTEFGQGNFIQVSGNQATDSLTLTVLSPQFGNLITVNSTVTLVKDGTHWEIDAITT